MELLSFDDSAPVVKAGGYDALAGLGLKGALLNRQFPGFVTAVSTSTGGMNNIGGPGQGPSFERRPSGAVNVTSVRGNHTFKLGSEWRLEKYPAQAFTNVSGSYSFSTATGVNGNLQPSLQGLTTSQGTTGFAFASFLTGDYTGVTYAQPTDTSTSKQQWGLFVQDTWKLTAG